MFRGIIVSNDTLFGVHMKNLESVFEQLFIFEGTSKEDRQKIADELTPSRFEYEKGDLIFSKEKNGRAVGFLLSGECEVLRIRQDGKSVLLNRLLPNDSFGILSVFSQDEDYPTEIYARKNTAVLFFSQDDIYKMIEKCPKVSLNIISFLTQRVVFLNKKIAAFSGSSVEQKLASLLYNSYRTQGAEFPLNCKRCSEVLGVGRASVYRAIDSLAADGHISFENKKIKIICPEGLERNAK